MSPVGGQGLNIALRDVIAAANELVPALRAGAAPAAIDAACARVEAARLPEVAEHPAATSAAAAGCSSGRGGAGCCGARSGSCSAPASRSAARSRTCRPSSSGSGTRGCGSSEAAARPLVGRGARRPGLTYSAFMREPRAGAPDPASTGTFAALRVRDFRVLWAGIVGVVHPVLHGEHRAERGGVRAHAPEPRGRHRGLRAGARDARARAARRRRRRPLAEAAGARADAGRGGGDVRRARAAARARPPHARRARRGRRSSLGITISFLGPARQAFAAEIVPPALRGNAVTLNQVPLTGSQVLGPAIAGLLLTSPARRDRRLRADGRALRRSPRSRSRSSRLAPARERRRHARARRPARRAPLRALAPASPAPRRLLRQRDHDGVLATSRCCRGWSSTSSAGRPRR